MLDADGERRAVWTSGADLDCLGQVHFVERRPARADGAIGVAEWEATPPRRTRPRKPTDGFDQ